MFLAMTDSGLGGLSICAAIERGLRTRPRGDDVRISYVNAWPEDGRGYNDYPDVAARVTVFDSVLMCIAAMRPDRILIACNTLSILYPLTGFSGSPAAPVMGIVDAGVDVFVDALRAAPRSSIVLLGTRTTIASRAHRDRLVAAGIEPGRVSGVPCHGLATAIERDIDGPGVGDLLAACAGAVLDAVPTGDPVFVGLCCTHYGYVADRIAAVLTRTLGRPVVTLDPNARMVRDVARNLPEGQGAGGVRGSVTVDVVSKIAIDDRTRRGVGGLVRPTSPATADALLAYRHVPDLF